MKVSRKHINDSLILVMAFLELQENPPLFIASTAGSLWQDKSLRIKKE